MAIVRGVDKEDEVAFVVVRETCAVAARLVGVVVAEVVLDAAL